MGKAKQAERTAKDRASTAIPSRSAADYVPVPFDLARWGAAGSDLLESGRHAGSALSQRLPSTDDAREAVASTAHRALGRARDAVEHLPESLQSVPVPGRAKKRGARSPKFYLLLLAIVVGGGFLVYRRFFKSNADELDELYAPNWPAQPANPPKAPREDDATAELDAEASAALRDGATAPTASQPGTV